MFNELRRNVEGVGRTAERFNAERMGEVIVYDLMVERRRKKSRSASIWVDV